ncbi:LuxR family two component transcriptional regulator [Halospina denitrificans]|uniref:LuxR family two component transcriptional regulator n=2 Tax=Halospina denitrificans TaxID=332522 RepID=A0A4R7K0E0_9GAMM|nr:LuxR family two component transcriptional regulator [Halospina denitrificans]
MGTPMKQAIIRRVLIVDDHPFFVAGLAQALQVTHGVEAVATADSLGEATRVLQSGPHPDLILLDLSLPDRGGLGLFGTLETMGLPIPVVVISSRDDEEAVNAARAAGAMGFVAKSCDQQSLARMLSTIAGGGLFFPDAMVTTSQTPMSLTPRQRDVLALLAEGYPNKRICQKLSLTDHTVKTHLKSLYSTLGVHNRTECANLARSMGLVD